MPAPRSTNFWQRYFLLVGSILLTVGFLYWARALMMPIVLAILLAFVLGPLVARMQRLGLGRIPSAVLAIALACAIIVGLGTVVVFQIQGLGEELPKHKDEIIEKISRLQDSTKGSWMENLNRAFDDITKQINPPPTEGRNEPVPVQVETSHWPTVLQNTLGPLAEVVVTGALILILAAFMLVQKENLRNRLLLLWGHGSLTSMTRAIDDAAQRISRFLLMQFIVNVSFGIAMAAGLLILGVPYALLWGCLGAVLRYIPYLGSWLAAGFPALLSVAVLPDWTTPLLVLAMIAGLEFFISNVIEPRAFGRSIGVSEVALLILTAFWAWLWGPVGLVLATPMAACLVVLGRHVPQLEFFQLLLGDAEVMEPHVSFFQRLLARDENEATDVIDNYVETYSPEAAARDVLVPALLLAEQNREREELTPDDEQVQHRVTRELMDEYLPANLADQDDTDAKQRLRVLCLPARDESDELALDMLGRLLASRGQFEVVSSDCLAGELTAHIEDEQPDLVVIVSLSMAGIPHVRYLCKRLRASHESLKIAAGLWGLVGNQEKAAHRLKAAGADVVGFSLGQTEEQLIPLLQFLPHAEERLPVAAK